MEPQLPPHDPLAALLAATTAPARHVVSPPPPRAIKLRMDLVLLGVVVVAVLGVLVVSLLAPPAAKPPSTATQAPARPQAPAPTTSHGLTLAQAQDAVTRARLLLNAGRFDEASALVDPIDGEIGDQVGASAMRDDIARAQAGFTQNVELAHEDMDAGDWLGAETAIAAATKIAPLPVDLQQRLTEIHRNAREQRDLIQAQDAFDRGDNVTAIELARAGYDRWHDDEFQQLLDDATRAEAAAHPATTTPAAKPKPAATKPAASDSSDHAAAHDHTAATPAKTSSNTPAAGLASLLGDDS